MHDTPHLLTLAAQTTAVIRLRVPRAEIQAVMGPGIAELLAAVTSQGIGPAGPLFSLQFRMDPGFFDFEIGVPVRAPVTPVGRVQAGALPGGQAARTVYRGGYEGLGAAWGAFESWLRAHGHTPAPELWESYVAGPESSANPADWQTEFTRPLLA